MINHQFLVNDFNSIIKIDWRPPEYIIEELKNLTNNLGKQNMRPFLERKKLLLALINKKMDFKKKQFQNIINYAANYDIYFNYHEKSLIKKMLDNFDYESFVKWINNHEYGAQIKEGLLSLFVVNSEEEIINNLHKELHESQRKEEILSSLFGGFIFYSFDEEAIHCYFQGNSSNYFKNFYDHLRTYYPQFFKRDCSLIIMNVNQQIIELYPDLNKFKNMLLSNIKDLYSRLNNHCYFAILIEPIYINNVNIQWSLYSDILLFAEKFKEVKLNKGYFKPKKIEEITSNYIKEINLGKAKFNIANEGFTYKDCFIIYYDQFCDYNMLLLFEKNERDETLIPCPSCRSSNVQGNSYPILNVRSWECKNIFCPERSKYNRGKRYSLSSLIRQEAIEEPNNRIPVESIRKWKLDVVENVNKEEIIEMAIRHYSLFGDNVLIINYKKEEKELYGRYIQYKNLSKLFSDNLLDTFHDSPFFHRFRIKKAETIQKKQYSNISNIPMAEVYNGDAFEVLKQFNNNSIDGAVTSPPYYNAREYSEWPNIYCYLYDMYNIALQVYRVLKPGAPYLFNIFDYFDNENTIVFSAMGKKRMILGAYIIHLFEKIGFKIIDNIIWHKGEIEGKRSFNQGNMSPYYQAPFNCWEHVFLFSKGDLQVEHIKYPKVLFARPVIKMVNGSNILGHSAPFPEEIPSLLINMLPQGSKILDPFAGSMTTGIVASKRKYYSINIDYNKEFCELGLKLLKKSSNTLF